MFKSIITLSMLFGLHSFAKNVPVSGGSDGAVAPAECPRGDAQQAQKFYDDTVEFAKQLRLNMDNLKAHIESGISVDAQRQVMARVKSTSLYESAMCKYQSKAPNVPGHYPDCDADRIEAQLRSKADNMILLATTHKTVFLEAIAAGSREKFTDRVVAGICQ